MRRSDMVVVVCATLVACSQVVARSSEVDVIGDLIGEAIALVAGQKFVSSKQVPESFGEYAMSDDTNEDLGHANPQEIISRAGFNYENHYSVSDDGYVTQLIRIVNPLADQSKLKQPPVMLLQGGITDVTIWIWGSNAQHHPEKYPRTARDGPMTSWNRSMAFTLSNNGYDVWLISHRGANEQNQGHVSLEKKSKMPGRQYQAMNFNESLLAELSRPHKLRSLGDVLTYWDYTMDDMAAYETPRQIDKVLSLTGASNVTLVPMSFSTIYALMALAKQPEYQQKIHNAVVVGPIINNLGTNRAMRIFHTSLCNLIPSELGTLFITELMFSQPNRDRNLLLGLRKDWRYAVLLETLAPLSGPSARFQTLLEPAVYGHILMPTGYKMIRHYCQVVTAGKMRHYDHGPVGNRKLYGDFFAPDYNVDVNLGNWLMVSGDNDILATPKSTKQYIQTVKPKPFEHIVVKGYSHLDLWAAIDNDVKINLPVLGFLDDFHLPPQSSQSAREELNNIKLSS